MQTIVLHVGVLALAGAAVHAPQFAQGADARSLRANAARAQPVSFARDAVILGKLRALCAEVARAQPLTASLRIATQPSAASAAAGVGPTAAAFVGGESAVSSPTASGAGRACVCCPRGGARPKIADVTSFSGSVVVTGADGTTATLGRRETRVVGGSLRCGDVIDVRSGSATVVMPDGSRQTLRAGSRGRISLSCKTVPRPQPAPATPGRRLREIMQKVVLELAPEGTSDFETPAACLGIRG
jgi:hypothetical protein